MMIPPLIEKKRSLQSMLMNPKTDRVSTKGEYKGEKREKKENAKCTHYENRFISQTIVSRGHLQQDHSSGSSHEQSTHTRHQLRARVRRRSRSARSRGARAGARSAGVATAVVGRAADAALGEGRRGAVLGDEGADEAGASDALVVLVVDDDGLVADESLVVLVGGEVEIGKRLLELGRVDLSVLAAEVADFAELLLALVARGGRLVRVEVAARRVAVAVADGFLVDVVGVGCVGSRQAVEGEVEVGALAVLARLDLEEAVDAVLVEPVDLRAVDDTGWVADGRGGGGAVAGGGGRVAGLLYEVAASHASGVGVVDDEGFVADECLVVGVKGDVLVGVASDGVSWLQVRMEALDVLRFFESVGVDIDLSVPPAQVTNLALSWVV